MPLKLDARPWLAHYDPEVKPNLDYETGPLFAFLDRAARDHPHRTAVLFRNYSLDYAELHRLAEIVAANLRALGIRPGDRVAVMLPNLPQTIVTYWGILKAGAVVVMTNPLYMEHEILHHFGDSGATALVVLDLLWPKIAGLRSRLPGLKQIFVTRISNCLRFPLDILYRVKSWRERKLPIIPYDNRTVFRWRRLLKGRQRYSHPGIDPARDLAALQYTGGTTGLSKGVMLTHRNLAANAYQCRAMLHGLGEARESFLGILPFFHIYGLTVNVNLPAAVGATILPFPRFVPGEALKAIDTLKPTIFPGAPSLYIALLTQKDISKYDLSSIRYCVSGSAPIPVEIMERFRKLTGATIVEGYGLTEASPVTHLNPLEGRQKPGSIGLPYPDTESAVVDKETGGTIMQPGEVGELVVRGPQVMLGYLNQPEETAATMRDGWLYTGDLATMDEEGYFYIVDRKKDLIISGGFNIYPREVDEVLYQHPKVAEAVTVGVPHPTRGETVKAFIVPKEGETLDKTEITTWCRDRLAHYKVPKQVEFRRELPKTFMGKVLRRALREEEAKASEERRDTDATGQGENSGD